MLFLSIQRILLFAPIFIWGGEVGRIREHKDLPLFEHKNVKHYKNTLLIFLEAVFPHRMLILQFFGNIRIEEVRPFSLHFKQF